MPYFSSPLVAIINPPDVQSGMPGEVLQLSVVIQNQGDQGAVIDLFLDQADQILAQWCRAVRQRLALDPQQSGEVIFEFELPDNALPGTYDYVLVVDAPEHYPEDTPMQFPQQLRVLLRSQTVVRINDPTFFLKPATNPQKPALIKAGETLAMQVRVENRANLVDRFRLTCLDLEEDWFTIRYPSSQFGTVGLQIEAAALELNPGQPGLIQLDIHPPIDTLAGVYSPTFRLHSDNQPDLVLLDLLYLDLRAVETLSVDLETITDRVSHSPGQYHLKLANRGNVIRQLSFSASSRDEDELCTYEYQPDRVRLLPGREAQVLLQVTPVRQWRRPFLGGGHAVNFQVELQDAQGHQLPERQPQGVLIWKARPWWQFLLLLLSVLALLGGIGALIWFLFFRPPVPIVVEEFKSDSPRYIEDDSVQVSWRIRNPDRIQRLELKPTAQVEGVSPIDAKTYEFNQGVPPADLTDTCPEPELLCSRYTIGKLAAGDYKFELQPVPQSGKSTAPAMLDLAVAAKPDPKVTRFALQQAEYVAGMEVQTSWTIENLGQIASLTLTATAQSGGQAASQTYTFDQDIPGELRPFCRRQGETLTCVQVPLKGLKSGQYNLQLNVTTKKNQAIQSQPTAVSIKPQPLRIVAFSLNGQQAPANVRLKVGEPLTIRWQVEGGEGQVKVEITPYGGNFPSAGTNSPGAFPTAGERSVQIAATDEAGQQVTGPGFVVTVIAPPPPPSPAPSSRSSPLQRPRSNSNTPPNIIIPISPGGI